MVTIHYKRHIRIVYCAVDNLYSFRLIGAINKLYVFLDESQAKFIDSIDEDQRSIQNRVGVLTMHLYLFTQIVCMLDALVVCLENILTVRISINVVMIFVSFDIGAYGSVEH